MNSFWDWFWLLVWWFCFFAYLIVLFQILRDLFRDRSVGGFAKAVWVIGLIVLPFLVALIYIIARGDGMARREMREMADNKAAADEYIRQTAGGGRSAAGEIADAKALLDSGAITAAEFETLKARALAG
ncbi:SHOCT domain-containing protein [Cellulomonas alba]|uniref:SHOCT domain-containing protein n=1 Tax=Cellulomonas alba TaxID=3053467 RepID=A0ABT7SL58_9CELL|nr:SHOCT domain-containing protein [Cellulomonas alba]MDM7856292.1 SHOCT domain-containing protein [Cellulomonas alba]